MGTYVVIKPDGSITKVPGGKKMDIHKLYELIGCDLVERAQVQFEGRKRDIWVDEEGLLKSPAYLNRTATMLSVDYWTRHGVPPQAVNPLVGTAVIWLSR